MHELVSVFRNNNNYELQVKKKLSATANQTNGGNKEINEFEQHQNLNSLKKKKGHKQENKKNSNEIKRM